MAAIRKMGRLATASNDGRTLETESSKYVVINDPCASRSKLAQTLTERALPNASTVFSPSILCDAVNSVSVPFFVSDRPRISATESVSPVESKLRERTDSFIPIALHTASPPTEPETKRPKDKVAIRRSLAARCTVTTTTPEQT